MKRLVSDMNPTLRGFILIALFSGAIVAVEAESALVAASIFLQAAFIVVACFFVYTLWRNRRAEIATWPTRAKTSFYGAAALILADVGAYWYARPSGPDALAFFLVLAICAFAMFRVWRDQHTYA